MVAGILPGLCLVAWSAVVTALKNARMMIGVSRNGLDSISRLDEYTSKLQLQFSVFLIIGFVGTAILF